jgi:hypothetical protein
MGEALERNPGLQPVLIGEPQPGFDRCPFPIGAGGLVRYIFSIFQFNDRTPLAYLLDVWLDTQGSRRRGRWALFSNAFGVSEWCSGHPANLFGCGNQKSTAEMRTSRQWHPALGV